MSTSPACEREGYHKFFVASRVLTECPARVVIVALCTSCGKDLCIQHDLPGAVVAFGNDTPGEKG